MSGWGSGYVTDVPYMTGYYRTQAPIHLSAACLMGGVASDIPSRTDDLSYLELGCGYGYGALALAASNPGWRVTGIDFNPAHIAAARRFAHDAGITNAMFLEADLSTLADSPAALAQVPEADVVSLHGVWSWVPQTVRSGIVRLMERRVRAGGVVHVSYNALPTWQRAIGMQRLIRDTGLALAGRSDRQAASGLAIVHALNDAEARHLRQYPFVQAMLERLKLSPSEYLAHEFMNGAWSPCFHGDVVQDFAAAKLDYVAAAQLPENFPALTLTEAQREVADRFDDPRLRELVKDMCIERGLRHDVFVRGATRVGDAARDAALAELWLALVVPAEDFSYEVEMPAGSAELGRDFYGAVVATLAEGPHPVSALVALAASQGRRENPAEVVAMLIGTEQAVFVSRPDAAPDPGAGRFNTVAAGRLVRLDQLSRGAALASTRLGAGMPCPMMDLYVCSRIARGEGDPAALARDLGEVLDDEERRKLQKAITHAVEKRAPMWRSLGIIA